MGSSSKNNGYVPGKSGIDVRFMPQEYRGMTMDQLEKQLDENLRALCEDRKKIPSSMDCLEAINEVRKEIGLDVFTKSYGNTLEQFSDYDRTLDEIRKEMGIRHLSDDRIKLMNRNVRHYKNQVIHALIRLERKINKCRDNVQSSRRILQELENAYPGSYYGSNEADDTVLRNIRFFFEDKIARIENEFFSIDKIHAVGFYESILALQNHESKINEVLDLTRGVNGLDTFHIKMNYSTEYDRFKYHDDHETNDEKNKDSKNNPELAHKLETLENEYRSIKDRKSWYRTQMRINCEFSTALTHLRTMKPIDETTAELAIVRIQRRNRYNDNRVQNWKAIAISDSGEILIDVGNRHKPEYCFVYNKCGESIDQIRNYKALIYDKNGKLRNKP